MNFLGGTFGPILEALSADSLVSKKINIEFSSEFYFPIFTQVLNEGEIVYFHISIAAKSTNQMAAFGRTGIFHKNGIVQLLGQGWQSDFTANPSNGFDIKYNTNLSTLDIEVKNPTSDPVLWTGFVITYSLN